MNQGHRVGRQSTCATCIGAIVLDDRPHALHGQQGTHLGEVRIVLAAGRGVGVGSRGRPVEVGRLDEVVQVGRDLRRRDGTGTGLGEGERHGHRRVTQ